ncbi:hypothetical protein DQ241_13665 [Blastococcus sp. TF02A-30]|nr:hypothetical protein DQ241_13665 [Blastococcus sp. TF02A-30]
MLGGMDLPAAAAGPWLALGAVLGIALLVAGWALARALRSRTRDSAGAAPSAPPDDLAEFLEHPPGTAPAGSREAGWVSLAPAGPPAPAEQPARGARPATVLAALALAVLVVVGVAAAVAAGTGTPAADPAPSGRPSTGAPSTGADDGTEARLAFEGIVLEEHAVGVTVAHPELELTTEDGRAVARLRLPTANCLTTRAPATPGDPACREARTEHAELTAPDLRVEREGDRLLVSGRFATTVRPAGTAPRPSGRVLELTVTVEAAGDEDADGWVPATGELRVGDQLASTREEESLSALRLGR